MAAIVHFTIQNDVLKLTGLRQVPMVSTVIMSSSLNQMSEKFTLEFKSASISRRHSVLVTRNKWCGLNLKKFKSTRKINSSYVSFNNENEFLKLTNTKILEFENIRKLKITDKKVKLVLFELPSDSKIIKRFVEYCKNLTLKNPTAFENLLGLNVKLFIQYLYFLAFCMGFVEGVSFLS